MLSKLYLSLTNSFILIGSFIIMFMLCFLSLNRFLRNSDFQFKLPSILTGTISLLV